jgi:hydrogenase maturation factor
MSLPFGKIAPELLERTVFQYLGAARDDVVLGPSKGEDAAIVKVGDRLLAFSCDPVSGAKENLGWIAVIVSTNDLATRGVRPRWLLSCILLPESSDEGVLLNICRQMDAAAKLVGAGIVGGHSEITPGLSHPIAIVSSAGVVENGAYVTCSGARAGGKIVMTKSAGLEGTAILAHENGALLAREFGCDFVAKAKRHLYRLSVLKEAMIAVDTGVVMAMHDPTEGGVAGGLHEIADASRTGFKVYADRIAVTDETEVICRYMNVDPLNLISSGCLLIVAEEVKADAVVQRLGAEGILASVIGEVLADENIRTVVRSDGSEELLPMPGSDELWKAAQYDRTARGRGY